MYGSARQAPQESAQPCEQQHVNKVGKTGKGHRCACNDRRHLVKRSNHTHCQDTQCAGMCQCQALCCPWTAQGCGNGRKHEVTGKQYPNWYGQEKAGRYGQWRSLIQVQAAGLHVRILIVITALPSASSCTFQFSPRDSRCGKRGKGMWGRWAM